MNTPIAADSDLLWQVGTLNRPLLPLDQFVDESSCVEPRLDGLIRETVPKVLRQR